MSRVVAVEDNPAHLALISSLMAELDHVAIPATDAESGLRLIEEERPDLVLCDIRLPSLSGYEVVRRMKGNPATRSVPVIAVTVLPHDEAMQADFDGYLAKPVSLSLLAAEIDRVLPGSVRSKAERTDPPARGSGNRTMAPAARTGKRILVLDDTDANREVMRTILDYGGHDVVCVNTVAAAFAAALSWRPHLVLCDTHLDHESGADLLRAMQASPELRDTRFAFTTASRGPNVEPVPGETGVSSNAPCLRLPMKPEMLLREVGKLLA